ncbi:MAG TPA: glycosyltransferase [Phycisphaerales bacterium]|nr:glycosyltransferase [Phycisphaerales bacterium]
MIKAAIIIERADIALGGAERSVFELASKLSTLNVKVTVLAAKGQMDAKNVKVLCPNASGKRTSLKQFEYALKDHFTRNHYDIIHSTLPLPFADVYQPRGGAYPESIVRNAASYDSKVVSSIKLITHYANIRRSELLNAERVLCTRGSSTVTAALSEYVAEHFRRHYNIDDDRLVTIRNGVKVANKVDTDEAYKLQTQIYTMLGIRQADDAVMCLFAANNFRLKGLTPLIKAMGILTKQKTARPVYLVVAGSGSSRAYRHLAEKVGASDRVIFLGKLRHIQSTLSICDIAVLPTYYDPCSRFILEALAAAKPVITTLFNGASEAFVDKRHGAIIDRPGDVKGLARAIAHFANPANAAEATRAIVEDKLRDKVSILKHGQKLVTLYDSILKRNRD